MRPEGIGPGTLESDLERLFEPRGEAPEPSAELERELAERVMGFAEVPAAGDGEPAGSGSGSWWPRVRGFVRAHRFAVAACGMAMATLLACAAPASVEVPLGVELALEELPESFDEDRVEDISQHFEQVWGADRITVRMSRHGHEGPTALAIQIWGGEGLPDELSDDLRQEFPELAESTIAARALEGEVETNLGGKLSFVMFERALAEEDVERARMLLLEEIAGGEVDARVEVEVDDSGGHRRVKIGVEKRVIAEPE